MANRKKAPVKRAGSKTRPRVRTAPYVRALPERRDEDVRAEIDQRVDDGARIREQIMAKIERGLADRRR